MEKHVIRVPPNAVVAVRQFITHDFGPSLWTERQEEGDEWTMFVTSAYLGSQISSFLAGWLAHKKYLKEIL